MNKAQKPDIRVGTAHYMPGLDGLRALSVLAVIAYHLNVSWAPGGLLGVGVFFTLSGYLITDQLMMQWQSKRRIDLRDFWLRRIRRLMPAMLFMLAVVGTWLMLFDRPRLDALQGDFLSSVLYFNNWWLIFHEVSYFESFGPPSPIGHLWSLAIEEQFYLLWPLILAFGLYIAQRRGKLMLFILLGAAASALAMAIIYVPGADPSRVYYGTDTRAFALLVGAALAVSWPSRNLSGEISGKSRLLLDIVGGVGLLAMIWLVWRSNEYNPFLYQGGLLLFSILSAIVTAVLAHPASIVAKVMGSKPLRWIGKRSYSLYLWHFPVIILTSPSVNTDGFNGGRAILQIMLSLLLAAISWKYIEEPIRRGSGVTLLRKIPFNPRYGFTIALFALILFLISCSSSMNAEKPMITETTINTVTPEITIEGTSPTVVPMEPPAVELIEIPDEPKTETSKGITAIGDSVILDAAPHLEKLLPGIVIDGKVGRQMSQAQDVVDQLRAEGKLGDRIIIELGTNGAFSKKKLRELLTSLRDMEQIVLVNTRVPRKWQNSVNSTLEEVAAEFPKAKIVDWYSASENKGSFFTNDGVHLKLEGAKYYASIVFEAIQQEE